MQTSANASTDVLTELRDVMPRSQVQTPAKKKLGKTMAYRQLDEGKVEIFDLDFAAYCLLRQLPIVDMIEDSYSRRNGNPTQYRFIFGDPECAVEVLSVDYTNSESARHADCVRRLKKAVRSSGIREG